MGHSKFILPLHKAGGWKFDEGSRFARFFLRRHWPEFRVFLLYFACILEITFVLCPWEGPKFPLYILCSEEYTPWATIANTSSSGPEQVSHTARATGAFLLLTWARASPPMFLARRRKLKPLRSTQRIMDVFFNVSAQSSEFVSRSCPACAGLTYSPMSKCLSGTRCRQGLLKVWRHLDPIAHSFFGAPAKVYDFERHCSFGTFCFCISRCLTLEKQKGISHLNFFKRWFSTILEENWLRNQHEKQLIR